MPTYSRVPVSGCVPLGFSLDRIGPMATSAWDCAAILSVIAGHHVSDPLSSREPVPDYVAEVEQPLGPLRIGVVRARRPADDARIETCFDEAVATLARAGATIVDIALPYTDELDTARVVTVAAEAYAYHEPDLAAHWSDYAAPARYFLALGALVSGRDYVQAQRLRRMGERALQRLFADVDVVAAPTLSVVSPLYNEFDLAWE
jgi:aspartyl-tRNA(Asn)/glutamyl-tRNA(Gln) amidotransferase subunit A